MTRLSSVKANAFIPFIKSCENFLGFLVNNHSFSKSEPKIMPPECWIEYCKDDIQLDVIYEYGDFPWIRVTINGKDNSLDNVIRKKWPEQEIKRKKGPFDPEERINFVLEKYSNFLKEHLTEII